MGNKVLLGIGLLSISMVIGCSDASALEVTQEEQAKVAPIVEQTIEEQDATTIPRVTKEVPTEDKETNSEVAEDSSEDGATKEVEVNNETQSEEIKITDASLELFVKKNVNIRKGPGTSYEKLGSLNKGEKVLVNGIAENKWYQFEYNGSLAYVSDKFLIDQAAYNDMLAKEEEAAKQAEEEAQAASLAQENADNQNIQEQSQPVATGNVKADVVALMNSERAANGVGGITEDATLDALAQIRAEEITISFDHTRPNGTSCFTVLDEGGVVYMAAGENIAAGQRSATEVMNSWMNSSGHRANILNGGFGKVGIGYVQGGSYGSYWVQIFTN